MCYTRYAKWISSRDDENEMEKIDAGLRKAEANIPSTSPYQKTAENPPPAAARKKSL